MSPSIRIRIQQAAWTLVGAGVLGISVYALALLLSVDPYEDRRASLGEVDEGIFLNGVAMRAYEGMNLVASANLDSVRIRRDRSAAEVVGISDGMVKTKDGDTLFFSAKEADYYYYRNLLQADGGVRVRGEEFDLASQAFSYDEREGIMLVPNSISGTLKGGNVTTERFTYFVNTERMEFGPAKWEGKIEDPRSGQQTRWKFETNDSASAEGDVIKFTNARATDGEVIVTGKSVEFNRKTDVLTASGSVEYFAPDANVIADKAVVYSKEKRTILTGNVSMLIKPEKEQKLEEVELQPYRPLVPTDVSAERPLPPPVESEDHPVRDPDNLRDYPVMVLAQQVEYWYAEGKERAVITGSPQARQEFPDGEWRMVWAKKGTYDGVNETLMLESATEEREVLVKTSFDDEINAKWFEISTKEGEQKWRAGAPTGFISMSDDRLPNRSGNPPPPTISGGIGN